MLVNVSLSAQLMYPHLFILIASGY